jgi:hypothetical protein
MVGEAWNTVIADEDAEHALLGGVEHTVGDHRPRRGEGVAANVGEFLSESDK